MLSSVVASFSFAPQLHVASAPSRATAPSMLEIEGPMPWTGSSEISDKAGMVALAEKLNPVVGFWGVLASSPPRACIERVHAQHDGTRLGSPATHTIRPRRPFSALSMVRVVLL